MRVLFVSGTSVGGAARSTYELAALLTARGHDVATLMRVDEDVRRTRRHKRAINARVKAERNAATRPLAPLIERVERSIGTTLQPVDGQPFPAWRAALVENALGAALASCRPDVVVVNSIERTAWRQIRDELRARGLRSVLYVREASGVRHLVDPPAPPDLLLANAEAHALEIRNAGFACSVIPSVVETGRCLVESSRQRALVVNPNRLYGVELALQIVQRRPDVPFLFVESWPLTADERGVLADAVRRLPNLEWRPNQADPRDVYREAKVLLMLCTVPSRPRVVLEAQANGIPVLATDRPGHREAVGAGGVLVSPEAPIDVWLETFAQLWDDDGCYAHYREAALAHAVRADASPAVVVENFEHAIAALCETNA